jgi:hypothetical protein
VASQFEARGLRSCHSTGAQSLTDAGPSFDKKDGIVRQIMHILQFVAVFLLSQCSTLRLRPEGEMVILQDF